MITAYNEYYQKASQTNYTPWNRSLNDTINDTFSSVQDYQDQWKPKLEFEIYETLLSIKYQLKIGTKVTQATANRFCEAYIVSEEECQDKSFYALRAYFNSDPQ